MKNLQHIGVYVPGNVDTRWLAREIATGELFNFSIDLQHLQGELFSSISLQHFIDEEIRHDHFEIETGNNNPLTTSSSGEQRKALLNFILSRKPGYVILDNVFDSLDKAAQQSILETLQETASHTLLIQVMNRKKDCLPFINRVYSLEGRTIVNKQTITEFLADSSLKHSFNDPIPPPLNHYIIEKVPLVKMNNVSVQFNGRQVLKNICWEINAGEFWQLIGPNGSGKSTLLAMITGDSSKGYGQELELFGKQKGTGETVWNIKEKIGYFTPVLTQQFERSDSIERMIIGGFYDSIGLYIKPTEMQAKMAQDWLRLIGMYSIRNQPFRMLPQGQQRMILVARAMIKHPPLLILDEPTSGLDDDSAEIFVALINKIAAETTTAILYVSHRTETGLVPQFIYELIPSGMGSTGVARQLAGDATTG